MTSLIKNKTYAQLFSILGATLYAFLAITANAVITTDLGTAPLVSSTTGDVLPNVMYILDNSGSMGNDYMPDYVKQDSYKCKETDEKFTAQCSFGDPAANTKEFNSIYYNPAITYSPGQNADGTDKTSMTSANTSGWTSVPIDAYGIQTSDPLGNGGVTNYSLIPVFSSSIYYPDSGYPDKVWCNASLSTVNDYYDPAICRKNDQYIYPTTTFNNAQYAYSYPYYYTVAAGEYCTNKNLTSCITATAPTATYPEPAKLRWCNSQANAAYTSNGNAGCQAKYIEGTGTSNYTYARWTGTTASNAGGVIKIKPETNNCGTTGLPSCVAPSAVSVSNITVNGVRIIPTTPSPALTITDTTSAAQRATLAAAIATAINTHVSAPDYIASALGDEVTITPVSASPTGVIAMTTTTATGGAVTGTVHAKGSFIISNARTISSVNSITVGGVEILNQTQSTASGTDNSASRNALANLIVSRINAYNSSPDYTAVSDGAATPKITITASDFMAASNGTLTVTKGGSASRLTISSVVDLAGGNGIPAKTYDVRYSIGQFINTPVVTTFDRVDIVPAITTYPKASTRTDCNAASCTYDQEMTNFANWFSYYRTRMQMMKTSTSRAFKAIDSRYRVGFITIANQSSNYVPIAPFNATQKTSWYDQLLSTNPSTSTPLRSALSLVGRIYAGKNPVSGFTADPVQYSCQQNFAILTTDGYWNGGGGVQLDGTTAVGNLDGTISGVQTPRPMYEGPTAASGTLADVSKYYYDTDLRTGTAGSAACTGSTRKDGSTGDVCNNNVFVTTSDNNNQQHMTTFTLGLGVDATLTYTSDYKDATEGDFYELAHSTSVNWPTPVQNTQSAVDDLWHAAVNGRGSYFSAKDPNQLAKSLDGALKAIDAKQGAGAAAATSTLNPVAGDNFAYVASYVNVKWTGNLEARTINTATGKVSEDAAWCVENVLQDTCATTPVLVTTGNSTTYQCVTPLATASASQCAAPGVYDTAAQTCNVEVGTSCVGTLQDNVSDTTDTRNIYMNVNGLLGSFTSANLTAVGKSTNFSNSFLASNLSQWSSLTDGTSGTINQRALVNSSSLVNYLRGNTGYEDRSSNQDATSNNRLYRLRETVLGDLVDSTPVYVGPPPANLVDLGYSAFKTAQATRAGTVYIGANDGMLHAINSSNGEERWAYIPTMVLDNMWKLADSNYGSGSQHTYFVDGDVVVNDVCTLNCTNAATAVWKTILVAGLNGGGKGYFALDVTDPVTPTLLWEFSTAPEYTGDVSYDNDMGYSFGNPIITRRNNGTWAVLVTSGYNNTTGSNPGKGFLYVLNAATGAKIEKYATGEGDDGVAVGATGPSGLAKINGFVVDGEVNNQVTKVYGGDLLGNLWRFDPNAVTGTAPFKLAILKDTASTPKVQSITVKPELGEASGKTIVLVGTGRYLGASDLADTQQQTLYGITDEGTTTLANARTSLVQQILTTDTSTATRSISSPSSVNIATGRGWYIDLDVGERQNVASQLVFGTLLTPTITPSSSVCSPGGTGYLNFLDYKTGAAITGNVVSVMSNNPIVGINVVFVYGKPVVKIVTTGQPTPSDSGYKIPFRDVNAAGFTGHRAIWRELTDEQK